MAQLEDQASGMSTVMGWSSWYTPSVTIEPISSVDTVRLEEAIRELPEKHRIILHHKYRRGLNAAEIAAELGLTHEDVRVCLHRAIRRLRERMNP